jgi:hypothetical protein
VREAINRQPVASQPAGLITTSSVYEIAYAPSSYRGFESSEEIIEYI